MLRSNMYLSRLKLKSTTFLAYDIVISFDKAYGSDAERLKSKLNTST